MMIIVGGAGPLVNRPHPPTCMTMEDPWEHMRVRFVAPSGDRSIHTIYCRKHAVRQSSTEFPLGRTVFCVGWPPYSTEDGVRDLFARVGQVMSVHLRAQPGGERDHATSRGGFLVCYVIFSEANETESAMKLCASSQPLHCATGPVGLSKWASQYQQAYRDERLLEAKLEAQIAEYDLWTKEDAKRKHLLAQPNEEGWITVGREGSSARKW